MFTAKLKRWTYLCFILVIQVMVFVLLFRGELSMFGLSVAFEAGLVLAGYLLL